VSYQDVANMAEDWPLRMRLIAAAAAVHPDNPMTFVEEQIWRITGQPGWDAAWTYARLTHPDDEDYEPGEDEGVITDAMIYDGIQQVSGAVRGRETDAEIAAENANQARLQAETDRQLELFTKQRELEIANPIIYPDAPAAVQLPYTPPEEAEPPVEMILDPNAPPPAATPFEEPIHG